MLDILYLKNGMIVEGCREDFNLAPGDFPDRLSFTQNLGDTGAVLNRITLEKQYDRPGVLIQVLYRSKPDPKNPMQPRIWLQILADLE